MLDLSNRKVCLAPLTQDEFVLVQAIGTEICAMLKVAYPSKSAWDIAKLYTLLKEKMRNFFVDLNEVDMHKQLRKFSLADILDALEAQGEHIKEGATTL